MSPPSSRRTGGSRGSGTSRRTGYTPPPSPPPTTPSSGSLPSSVADPALAAASRSAGGQAGRGVGDAAPPGTPARSAIAEAVIAVDDGFNNASASLAESGGAAAVATPVVQLVERTFVAPLRALAEGPPPDAGTAEVVSHYVNAGVGVAGAVMNAASMPGQLVDTAIASLTSAIMPPGCGFPAAVAGTTMHMGMPHTHAHPPSLIPPAPPIPLPSIGQATGPGCVQVLINGMPALRCGDTGIAPTCGTLMPALEIITGSSNVFIGGKRAARAMDMTRVCNPMAIFAAMAAASAGMSAISAVVQVALAVAPGVAGAFAANERSNRKSAAAAAAESATEAALAAAEAEAAAVEVGAQAMSAIAAAAQIAADAATDILRATVGKDPGVLPPPVTIVGMLQPIPMGPPVLIGGLPMPPLGDMLNLGLSKLRARRRSQGEGSDSEGGTPRRGGGGDGEDGPPRRPTDSDDDARPNRRTQDEQNQAQCADGEPVDASTGATFNTFLDYRSEGLFRWERSYNSSLCATPDVLGRGFRHRYQRSLKVRLHRCELTDELGRRTRFPRFNPHRFTVHALGYTLTRVDPNHYRVERHAEPTTMYVLAPGGKARIEWMEEGESRLEFEYDEAQRLTLIREQRRGQLAGQYRLDYNLYGYLISVSRDGFPVPLVRYEYDLQGCQSSALRWDGGQMSFSYDAGHRMSEWLDVGGYRYFWRYDRQGRCVWTTGEDGLWESHFEYEQGFTRVRRHDGGTRTYYFRNDGILTKVEDPIGGVIERVVDERGRVVKEIDAAGRAVDLVYDAAGALVGRRDPFGNVLPSALVLPRPENPQRIRLPESARGWLVGSLADLHVEPSWHLSASVRRVVEPLLREENERRAPSVERNHLGNIERVIDGYGRTTRYRYDLAGNRVEETDRDGRTTRWEIARWNLVAAVHSPLGQTTRYEYNPHEKVTAIFDPLGSPTYYDYDAKDRLVRVRVSDGICDEYDYDVADRLLEKRDGSGKTLVRFEPHQNGYPAVMKLTSGEVITFDYDRRGRVRESIVLVGEVESRVRRRRDYADRIIFDERDGVGIRRWFGGRHETRTHLFERFTIQHQTLDSGAVALTDTTGATHYMQMRPNSVVERKLAHGTDEILQYDAEGQLLGRVVAKIASDGAELIWSVKYERSAEGDVLGWVDSVRGEATYDYDAAHRLIGYQVNGERVDIELDAAGNIVQKTGRVRDATYGEGNRVSRTSEENFYYDERRRVAIRFRPAGNTAVQYRYDSLGQLVSATDCDAEGQTLGTPWTAEYDGLGRRTRFGRGDAQVELYWDGDRIAAEKNPQGQIRIYLYQSIESLTPVGFVDYDSLDAAPESGRVYHVYSDGSGMPLAIEDTNGEYVWWATRIDPHGLIDVHPSHSIEYWMRWPGHRHDPDTGLHYNRFRDYDPVLGRYLTRDPIGQKGGINVYGYSANPLKEVDILGLAHQNSTKTQDGQGDGETRPAREGPDTAARQRHAPEWGVDAATGRATTDGTGGMTPAQIDAAARRPATADEPPIVRRRRRYLDENPNGQYRDPDDMGAWQEHGYRLQVNRDASGPHEQAAVAGRGGVLNNGSQADGGQQTHTHREWVDELGRSRGEVPRSLDENGQPRRDSSGNFVYDESNPPEGARGTREMTTRPDGTRGSDVIEHKHLTGDNDVYNDDQQLRAGRQLASDQGGQHELVLTSDRPLQGTPPHQTPPVRPSSGAARGSTVYYHDPASGRATHVWDSKAGTWEAL